VDKIYETTNIGFMHITISVI